LVPAWFAVDFANAPDLEDENTAVAFVHSHFGARRHGARSWLSLSLALVMVSALLVAAARQRQGRAGGFFGARAKLLPAVVNISTTQTLKADRHA